MNILFAIALTTGILSGIWGWVAVALGLLSWAGFLGCTAYFACPQGGLKGLAISSCTVMSGVVWALVIIHGSALAPQLQIPQLYDDRYRRLPDVHSGATDIAVVCTGHLYRRLRDFCGRRRLAPGGALPGVGVWFLAMP